MALLALGPLIVAAGNVSAVLVPLMLIPLYAVNELARFTQEEQRKSMLDELTGLPNRKALFAEMRVQARVHAERSARATGRPQRMALLLLDIDQFRQVNDALGHAVGDRLLGRRRRPPGRVRRRGRLRGAARRRRVRRPGPARSPTRPPASVLAERVADALAEPVTLDGLPLDVTAAIGVAVHPDHGTDNTTLLRHAEVAMYDAKDRGATHAIYAPESDQNSPERLAAAGRPAPGARVAGRDEIQLFYQPQVDLATGRGRRRGGAAALAPPASAVSSAPRT